MYSYNYTPRWPREQAYARLHGGASDLYRSGGPDGGRACDAFLMLKEKGHDLYLWSSGGAGYAATAADPLRWRTSSAASSTSVRSRTSRSISPSDGPSVVEAHGGYRITPFAGDLWDEELLRAAEAVEASGGGATR